MGKLYAVLSDGRTGVALWASLVASCEPFLSPRRVILLPFGGLPSLAYLATALCTHTTSILHTSGASDNNLRPLNLLCLFLLYFSILHPCI